MIRDWKRVVFAAECDEDGLCPVCKDIDFGDCLCPGPTQEDEFEYRMHDGELQARRLDRAYYNENDPYAAEWLNALIEAGEIPPGHVDARSIVDVQPEDLDGFTQCHFFAGIGGWPLAARLAGWPDSRPIWTGSCPCQPFSVVGRRRGDNDARHLWPEFLRLIAQRRPAVVVGEQVASRLGREWLAGVRTDLEELAYAVGAADLCAASAGAPHIRQRLYWLGQSLGEGLEGHAGYGDHRDQPGWLDPVEARSAPEAGSSRPWSRYVISECSDGTRRRIEPGVQPLAHGVPARVGRLRGYGNAIVPQVAATFLRAAMVTP